MWSVLLAGVEPYRPLVGAILGLQLIGTVASLFLPSLNADIIDNGVVTGDTGYILRLGVVMLAVSLLQITTTIAAVRLAARTAMGLGRDLRASLFEHVGRFSAREVARFGAPSLITRNTNDVQQIQMLAMTALTMMVTAAILGIGGIIMAVREDIGLSWLVAVVVPVLVVLIGVIVARMIPGYRVMQARLDDINRVLREQTSGIRVIRAFVREPMETERFERTNTELTDVSLDVGRWMALMFPTMMFVVNASSVAVLWFGAVRLDNGQMQIGSLTAYLTYLTQILFGVMMSTMTVIMAPRAAVAAERITEVLDTEPSVRAPSAGRTSDGADVRFDRVGFRYAGASQPVLTDVSFLAEPGMTTAIVGSTGAGKTTMVNLIPRLIDATSGSVSVGGLDVAEFEPDALWAKIGLVPQRAYLFSGTVASNLRYGRTDATEEQMWEALEIAQAADFVSDTAGGLDAPIAQGGTNVSGGQRQRLAIARAVIRRPDIYLFDDSFSALDVATDARLRAALALIVGDATVITVAQRVFTITDADQIVVLEDGAVMGLGTHDELLGGCPTYREIVDSQLKAAA
ncbi:MAG: ABC transporter ATP-binding protein/permease [Acidimicrobiia bacterium]|nr:ABC transporter ATP-binding protein/permease [Acidimicrobiia bacterium]